MGPIRSPPTPIETDSLPNLLSPWTLMHPLLHRTRGRRGRTKEVTKR
ncbi:hypothetical protein Nmel_008487, partial [Mimus melanotis]